MRTTSANKRSCVKEHAACQRIGCKQPTPRQAWDCMPRLHSNAPGTGPASRQSQSRQQATPAGLRPYLLPALLFFFPAVHSLRKHWQLHAVLARLSLAHVDTEGKGRGVALSEQQRTRGSKLVRGKSGTGEEKGASDAGEAPGETACGAAFPFPGTAGSCALLTPQQACAPSSPRSAPASAAAPGPAGNGRRCAACPTALSAGAPCWPASQTSGRCAAGRRLRSRRDTGAWLRVLTLGKRGASGPAGRPRTCMQVAAAELASPTTAASESRADAGPAAPQQQRPALAAAATTAAAAAVVPAAAAAATVAPDQQLGGPGLLVDTGDLSFQQDEPFSHCALHVGACFYLLPQPGPRPQSPPAAPQSPLRRRCRQVGPAGSARSVHAVVRRLAHCPSTSCGIQCQVPPACGMKAWVHGCMGAAKHCVRLAKARLADPTHPPYGWYRLLAASGGSGSTGRQRRSCRRLKSRRRAASTHRLSAGAAAGGGRCREPRGKQCATAETPPYMRTRRHGRTFLLAYASASAARPPTRPCARARTCTTHNLQLPMQATRKQCDSEGVRKSSSACQGTLHWLQIPDFAVDTCSRY